MRLACQLDCGNRRFPSMPDNQRVPGLRLRLRAHRGVCDAQASQAHHGFRILCRFFHYFDYVGLGRSDVRPANRAFVIAGTAPLIRPGVAASAFVGVFKVGDTLTCRMMRHAQRTDLYGFVWVLLHCGFPLLAMSKTWTRSTAKETGASQQTNRLRRQKLNTLHRLK